MNKVMNNVAATTTLIRVAEGALAKERGYLPLDGQYEQALTPIVAALTDHVTLDSKELADRFCAKVREAEELRDRRDEQLPEGFIGSMQDAGYLDDSIDVTAAILLMQEFAALQPMELPPTDGERHLFNTEEQVIEFFETFERWETHDLVTRLTMDGKYCVDVVEDL